MDRTELALEIARETGFDLAGVAPLRPPAAAGHFERWLEEGRHGTMDWLERQRERIVDPRRVLPGARSLLVVGLAHSRPPFELGDGARVARYAAGRDYHNVVGKMLQKLARRLEAEGLAGPARGIVDAGPILERSHAAEAGLGFESKAANLLHPAFGPWFFLGELLLGEELEPTADPPAGSCGTCTACLDACPTGAIVEPGVVHSPDCISYLTIEHRGPIDEGLREGMGEWAFGCDVCSEVCPWARRAPDLAERFGVHEALEEGSVVAWLDPALADRGPGGEERFREHFRGSPLQRPRRAGLARNAAIVLGNRPSEPGREVLLRALDFDPAPLVREAAGWALARGYGGDAGVAGRLEAAAGREVDAGVAERLRRHRGKLGRG